ncbi:hypothetical protein ACH4FX_38645 [Streptomyces sp. NPDC018019]|uniref:hypothetical protein n=1 Tax=Streptomyces sp. NPDC018019 TaxID=3365030 RepID=UPI003795BBEC
MHPPVTYNGPWEAGERMAIGSTNGTGRYRQTTVKEKSKSEQVERDSPEYLKKVKALMEQGK